MMNKINKNASPIVLDIIEADDGLGASSKKVAFDIIFLENIMKGNLLHTIIVRLVLFRLGKW